MAASRCLKYTSVSPTSRPEKKNSQFIPSLRKYSHQQDNYIPFTVFEKTIGSKRTSYDHTSQTRRGSSAIKPDKGQVLYDMRIKYSKKYPEYRLERVLLGQKNEVDKKFGTLISFDPSRPETPKYQRYMKKVAKQLGLNTYHNERSPNKFDRVRGKVESGLSPAEKAELYKKIIDSPRKEVKEIPKPKIEKPQNESGIDTPEDDEEGGFSLFYRVTSEKEADFSEQKTQEDSQFVTEPNYTDNTMITNMGTDLISTDSPFNSTFKPRKSLRIVKELSEHAPKSTPRSKFIVPEKSVSIAQDTTYTKETEDKPQTALPKEFATDDTSKYTYFYQKYKSPVARRRVNSRVNTENDADFYWKRRELPDIREPVSQKINRASRSPVHKKYSHPVTEVSEFQLNNMTTAESPDSKWIQGEYGKFKDKMNVTFSDFKKGKEMKKTDQLFSQMTKNFQYLERKLSKPKINKFNFEDYLKLIYGKNPTSQETKAALENRDIIRYRNELKMLAVRNRIDTD